MRLGTEEIIVPDNIFLPVSVRDNCYRLKGRVVLRVRERVVLNEGFCGNPCSWRSTKSQVVVYWGCIGKKKALNRRRLIRRKVPHASACSGPQFYRSTV